MFLQQLFEAVDKRHAAFAFGRMNPPTLGHKQLADTVAKSAGSGDYFIFTSQTQDSKKNPLDYATKVRFLRALMPVHAGHIVYDPSLKTIIQIAHWLYAKGYRSVTFVAGSDRLDNFKELLEKYNGVEGPNGFYKFDTINFASSGDRDPDGDGLAGISATAAREAAKTGNLEQFARATGAGELAKPLYLAVRKGMLLEGLTEQDDIDPSKVHRLRTSLRQYLEKAMPGVNINERPGGGVWTRGDGTRHRDPAKLSFKTVAERDQAFELLTKALTGARKTQVSGEFGSDPHQDALIWKGKVIGKYDSFSISIGSASRVTNPNSVWREKPVAESEMTPGELRDMYNYYVNVKGMSPEEAERLVYTRDEKLKESSGYIPKNKREAKDPRWSNALTVDVHPDTPRKNMKALRLI
jgi:hypothetical protein